MDVKQDSVLIAIRYVLLDFRQNGHEKWYVYLLHFVVNCIASFFHLFCLLFSVKRNKTRVGWKNFNCGHVCWQCSAVSDVQ